jgi:hypothetical protein
MAQRFCSKSCAAFARPRPSFLERFMAHVSPEPNSGCWLWTGFVGRFGYGEFKRDGRPRPSHRLSFELKHGPIPRGLVVCHRCDVRCCVNPAHLFLGTHSDNNADKVAKGRQSKGEGNNSKLTTAEVHAIRLLRGVPQRQLAAVFGVCQGVIGRIQRREQWRHAS